MWCGHQEGRRQGTLAFLFTTRASNSTKRYIERFEPLSATFVQNSSKNKQRGKSNIVKNKLLMEKRRHLYTWERSENTGASDEYLSSSANTSHALSGEPCSVCHDGVVSQAIKMYKCKDVL